MRSMPARLLFAGQLLLTLALVAFMVTPVVMSVMAGLTVNYFRGIASGLTFKWVEQVWMLYQGSVWLSMEVALATLVITLAVGVPAGYTLARTRSRWARVIEEMLVLPVALPGLATALALLKVIVASASVSVVLTYAAQGATAQTV